MKRKRLFSLCCIALLCLTACASPAVPQPDSTAAPSETPAVTETPVSEPEPASEVPASEPASETHVILLEGRSARLDGAPVAEYDYTWHCDPTVSHDEVKNAPAEYHTGSAPETDAAVYIDSDLPYFPLLDAADFQLVNYDGEAEWAYYYADGAHDEFIFATLPRLGDGLPAQMMHSEAEAAENRVLHIVRPGTYSLEGSWQGQIRIELGDPDAVFADESAKVTLILNGADITCTVAPGILFAAAYECDNTWESRESHTCEADAEGAGAVVLLAEGTENSVTGCNVYRMLKTKYKDENSTDPVPVQKKQRKLDAAFYSCVSMEVGGSGSLKVSSSFEGLDSELHLTFRDGSIEIFSQDDGINVNEDNVSVVRFSGGEVTLYPALGAEGDGVDSNGFIVLDGGTLSVNGVRPPDSALDSEDGITYLSGTVILDGETQTYAPGSVFRETGGGPGGFAGHGAEGFEPFGAPNGEFDLADFKEKVAALPEDATLTDVLALLGIDSPMGEMRGDSGGLGEGQPPVGLPGEGQRPPEGLPGGEPPAR